MIVMHHFNLLTRVISLLPAENDIDFEVFETMTEADLKDIGIGSFGVRRRLKLLIEKLHSSADVSVF